MIYNESQITNSKFKAIALPSIESFLMGIPLNQLDNSRLDQNIHNIAIRVI